MGFHVLFTLIGFVFSQDLDSGKYLNPRAYWIFPVMRLLSANKTARMANLSNYLTVSNSNSACLKEITKLLFLHWFAAMIVSWFFFLMHRSLLNIGKEQTVWLKCKALSWSNICMLQLLSNVSYEQDASGWDLRHRMQIFLETKMLALGTFMHKDVQFFWQLIELQKKQCPNSVAKQNFSLLHFVIRCWLIIQLLQTIPTNFDWLKNVTSYTSCFFRILVIYCGISINQVPFSICVIAAIKSHPSPDSLLFSLSWSL